MNNLSSNSAQQPIGNVLNRIVRFIETLSEDRATSNNGGGGDSNQSSTTTLNRLQQVISTSGQSAPLPSNPSPLPSGYSRGRSSVSNTGNGPLRSSTSKRKTSGFVGRLRTWNKDVVCLPYSRANILSIPRGKQRGELAERGLIGKIRLMSTWTALQVKEEVTSVFAAVFGIGTGQLLDYDYLCVMTGMKKLKRPSVSISFSWSGSEVASLAGQGSLYIMANTPLPSQITSIDRESEDSDTDVQEINEDMDIVQDTVNVISTEQSQSESTNEMDNDISTSDSSDLQTLQAMFPHTSSNTLGEILRGNLTIDLAIEEILSNPLDQTAISNTDAFDVAEYFGRQLTGDIFLLSIDRQNLWTEAFMFYKRGVGLDRPFRVSFIGDNMEIGIDTGGLRREFFQLLADNLSSPYLGFFEGSIPNLLPTMQGPSLRLGHFRIIGTIIAHSIVNGGIGFNYLARPLFEYIVNQNAEACLMFCRIEMVPNKDTRDLIDEISVATAENFGQLATRPDVLDLVFNAGWTSNVIYSNKEHIVATLLLHELLWKRESAINQLLEGLKFLNVLDAVRKFPQHFQNKLVYTEVPLNANVLKDHLEFTETSNNQEERVKEFFLRYINENVEIPCGEDKRFKRCSAVLQFTAGQQSVAGGLPNKIVVGYVAELTAIYPTAGTCGLKLYLPTVQQTYEDFSRDLDKAFEIESFGFECF